MDLLICDELGFVPFDRTGGEILFHILADRYERRSTMVSDVVVHPDLGHGVATGFDNWGMHRVLKNLYGRTLRRARAIRSG